MVSRLLHSKNAWSPSSVKVSGRTTVLSFLDWLKAPSEIEVILSGRVRVVSPQL